MSERGRWTGLRPVMAAAAALALAGCAATHVGEDWQCPIAQGEVCTSVAAADPAVPAGDGTGSLAAAAPLYRAGDAPGAAVAEVRSEDERECGSESGCNPLAWLAALFHGIAGVGDGAMAAPADGGEIAGSAGPDPERPTVPEPATAPDASGETASPARPAEAASTAKATPPLPAASDADGDGPSGAGLRAPEVIGRVWIAPFVDAGGIYREAHWVRVVMAPAEWRLP